MSKPFKPIILVLSLLIVSCNNINSSREVTISIVATGMRLKDVVVSDYKNLDKTIVTHTTLDSIGNGILHFNVANPTFESIQIGNKYAELYLEPGYNLLVSIDSGSVQDIYYSGKGSDINTYLLKQNRIVEGIKVAGGAYIGQLEPSQFFKRLDSLEETIGAFHKHFSDSVSFSKAISELLLLRNKVKVLAICNEYAFLLQNNSLNEQKAALENDRVPPQFKMPVALYNRIDNIPFDTTLLRMGLFDYTHLLQMHIQTKIYLHNYKNSLGKKGENYFEIKAANAILSSNYPSAFKEYFSAINTQYWLSILGIKPSTDSLYNDFFKTYKNSIYQSALKKNYDSWLMISPGMKAPDFTGATLNGDNLSLRDLNGNIIYIDVWATWCAPCKEEIPAAKKLQSEFSGSEKITFLNISIDTDKNAWMKFLEKNKDWKGVHINQNGEQSDQFWRAYKMSGVPTYILIDQEGKIVDATAERPSSDKIKAQMLSLLHK